MSQTRSLVAVSAVLAACCGFAESSQNPARIAEIMAMLDDEPGFPQVRVDRREFWDKAPAEWIGEAEKIVVAGVSRPSEEGYTEVRTNIERVGWEVESLFRAECRENKGRFLPAIRTCIDGLCKARTWVNPYHDRGAFGNFYGKYRSIELNCSEVAFKLAMGLDWLKGRLSDDDVARAMSALDLHIIQPYLRSARTGDYAHHGWFLGNNNWNVACHWQSCCVALSVVRDRRVRAEFIEAAERAAPYYLRGFSKEGYCQEGLDYWNYGFSEFLRLTHLLYNATKGGVDLSKLPKAKDCFLAPYLFQLANGCAPQFNDGTASVPSSRTLYYGEFFWPEAHTAATKGVTPFSCGWNGYALVGARPVETWWPPRRDGQPYKLPIRSFFEDAQILLVRPLEEGDNTLSACLKGGNNGVPHNHNDLGQFIIALGSTQMVQDPAGKVYDLETFTAKRYNHPMLNSYGHAVPLVDGTLQAAGRERTSKIVRTSFSAERDTIAMDLTGAYTNAILKSLVREMTYRRSEGIVEIADRAEYARAGRFETPLSTYGRIERLGENDFVIVRETKDGVKRLAFTIDTQGAKWHVREEKIPNPKRTEPTRWAVVLDEPATDFNVRFTFYRPVRTVDLGTADLILLDSQWDGHVNGNLDDAQQEWLAKVLPDWKRPVFVGAHHPAAELKVCGRPMVKFLIDCPGVKGWIFGHHHEWRKSCLHAYGGANNKDLIRSLTLPSATYCGDIGFVRFETSADRAVASLDEKGFWFEQRLRPGERVPALWEAVVEENRGDTCAFPYERPLRTI